LKEFPSLKYLQLVGNSDYSSLDGEDKQPYGYVPVIERVAREAIEILSNKGLRLDFFTVAMRDQEIPSFRDTADCHLRVREDPTLSEEISEKALKCSMEELGDLRRCIIHNVVEERIGHRLDV
jgi:hypothetical protein